MTVLRFARFVLIVLAAVGVAGYARRAAEAREAPDTTDDARDTARELPAPPLARAGRTEIPEFDDLTFYLSELAPPPRDGRSSDPRVRVGEELFAEVGCSACHVPALEGSAGPVPLYSDLLLHEVTPVPEALTRRSTGRTKESEPTGFRAPPLWGVARTAPYMHDGRAATLRDAILARVAEAQRSRAQFEQLDAHLAEALLAFLEDL